jgi:hypothetical protein
MKVSQDMECKLVVQLHEEYWFHRHRMEDLLAMDSELDSEMGKVKGSVKVHGSAKD